VLVIDQKFDRRQAGAQRRLDIAPAAAIRHRSETGPRGPDRLGLAAPACQPADLEDDPDRLFRDMTDWSLSTDRRRPYRYNDRELQSALADNAPKTSIHDGQLHPLRADRRHPIGGGMSAPGPPGP